MGNLAFLNFNASLVTPYSPKEDHSRPPEKHTREITAADIPAVAAAVLPFASSLIREWFPNAKRQGGEWVVGSIYGEPGSSFSINERTGCWGEFNGGGETGGDLVSLHATKFRVSNFDAARELKQKFGLTTGELITAAPTPKPAEEWLPMMPVPEGAGSPPMRGTVHTYRDHAGRVLLYVERTEATASAPKTFRPWAYGTLGGVTGWHRRHPHAPRPLFGLDHLAARPDAPVVVCEGERACDAAAALLPGYVAISWPAGANSVKHADWTPLIGRDVVIWPDNDAPGLKAAAEIAAKLPGARTIDVADLPEGADAADLDPAEGAAWFEARLRAPAPTGQEGPQKRLTAIWANEMAPRLMAAGTLIKGVLDQGAMSVVYAPSNVGKSFFALDLAWHVAAGLDWRGRKVRQSGCVLYLAAEGGSGLYNRVAAIRAARGDIHDLPLAVVPSPVNLLDPAADLPAVIRLVDEVAGETGRPVVFVIVDTLSRAMAGGDENSSKDMTAFVANLDVIRDACKAHLMVIHHAGKDVAKGARGHSSLRAATDTEIEIARVGNGPDKTAVATVRKQRDMAGDEEFPFTLQSIMLGYDEDGEAVTSAVVEHLDEIAKPEPSAATKGRTDAKLDALRALIALHGFEASYEGVPAGVRITTLDAWREALEEAGLVAGDSAGAKRMQFTRAREALERKGGIGIHKGWVWLGEEARFEG